MMRQIKVNHSLSPLSSLLYSEWEHQKAGPLPPNIFSFSSVLWSSIMGLASYTQFTTPTLLTLVNSPARPDPPRAG